MPRCCFGYYASKLIEITDSCGDDLARLEPFAAWFVLLLGWRRYFAAFITGLLSALAMAPLDFFPILFVTFAIFVWIMDGVYADGKEGWLAAVKKPFLCGWWFGFGYFLVGLWWIGNAFLVEAEDFAWLLPFAVILLPAAIAGFWGLAAVIARLFWNDHWGRVFAFAGAFGLMEFLRGFMFTGFPWNAPGYALMVHPVLMQSSSVIGLYGMTLVAFLIFALPLVVFATPRTIPHTRKTPIVLVFLILVGHVGYGAVRLSSNPTEFEEDVTIRLIQPNIDQGAKFDEAHEAEILKTYVTLSNSTSASGKEGLEDTDYVIWPESAFPFLLTERRDVLTMIGEMLPEGTQLITGAMRAEPGAAGNIYGKVYNSVYVIDENGEIVEATDKNHLLPFGEYLPFQETLEAIGLRQLTQLRGGFEAGSERKLLLQQSGFPMLALICYEIIFSGELLEPEDGILAGIEGRPKWIVNVTNDGWFGFTPGPYQHLRQSVVRAVEEGLPVIRVANTGVSAVIDPLGRTLHRTGLGLEAVIDTRLPRAGSATIFSMTGHLGFYGLLGLFFLIALVTRRKVTLS